MRGLMIGVVAVVLTLAVGVAQADSVTEYESLANNGAVSTVDIVPVVTGTGVTIDFQQLVNNNTLPIGTVVTGQFASQGVVFSLERIQDASHPGPIADGFGDSQTRGLFNTFNYRIPILADFSVPVRMVTFGSIVQSPLSVEAFDEHGTLIARKSIGGAPDVGQITSFADIHRLRLLNDSGQGYLGRDDLTIISTLSFSPVPEPSTLVLLGIGALGFLTYVWRRRRVGGSPSCLSWFSRSRATSRPQIQGRREMKIRLRFLTLVVECAAYLSGAKRTLTTCHFRRPDMRPLAVGLGALAWVLLTSWQVGAAVITFTGIDPGVGPGGARPNADAAAASFDAAAGGLGARNVIALEDLPIGNFSSRQLAPGVTATLTGTASDSNAGITNVGGDATLGFNTTLGGSKHLRVVPIMGIGTAVARFDFTSPIAAFGTYLTGLGTANGNLHVTFIDDTSRDLAVVGSPSGGVEFFGFTDAGASISSVSLELRGVTGSSRDIFGIDDLRFVTVPEPSTLILLGVGAIGLLGYGWRQRVRRLTVAKAGGAGNPVHV